MNLKTCHSIDDLRTYGYVTLNEKDNECEGIVRYEKDRNTKHVYINYVEMDEEQEQAVDELISYAFEDILENGFIPVPKCKEALAWYEKQKKKMAKKNSIMEIEANTADGSKKSILDDDSMYELYIEYPVREACRIFNEKGIKTIMSSANRNDAIEKDKPEKSGKHLYIGQNQHYSIGNGYAWIMIDYKELSTDNREMVNSLNSGDIGIDLTKEANQRFINNCGVNQIDPVQSELVKFYRVVDEKIHLIHSSVTEDDYFSQHTNVLIQRNSLSYHGSDFKAVVFRYPVDEKTSTDEIANYFNNIANMFKENRRIKIVR